MIFHRKTQPSTDPPTGTLLLLLLLSAWAVGSCAILLFSLVSILRRIFA